MTRITRPVDISYLAIAKVLGAALLVAAVVQLRELLGLIVASVLLAVTFDLGVLWLERRGVKRAFGITLVVLGVVAVMAAIVLGVVPALAAQIQTFGQNLPKLKGEILEHVPGGWVHRGAEQLTSHPELVLKNWPDRLLAFGSLAVGAVSDLLILLIFSFYFLADGRRAFEWVVTFFKPATQGKIRETAEEAGDIVAAYVAGQLITSLMVAVFAGALLSALHVPGALMLAVFAAVADIVPVVGITIAISLAALTALSVSPATALWVALAFLTYQGLENYFIAPKVYGSRLEVSNLVVLLSLAVGGLLGGALGVLLALPMAAAYPAIERIWLKKYLGAEVVEQHRRIQEAPKAS